ncbi:MAG: thioredoxin family protein [Flavobacteriales bacterium]
MTPINSSIIAEALSYNAYMELTEQLVKEGKTSGPNQSEAYVYYTKLNLQRMKRLNKTIEIPGRLKALLDKKANGWTWVVLSEPWCGDAAQCVPVLEKIAQTHSEIKTIYLLRDEHPTVMDAYLTNGGRSIPKLICLDQEGKEIFTWGPRPAVIQEVMNQLKAAGVSEIAKIVEEIQKAYNADQQAGIYTEFESLLEQI